LRPAKPGALTEYRGFSSGLGHDIGTRRPEGRHVEPCLHRWTPPVSWRAQHPGLCGPIRSPTPLSLDPPMGFGGRRALAGVAVSRCGPGLGVVAGRVEVVARARGVVGAGRSSAVRQAVAGGLGGHGSQGTQVGECPGEAFGPGPVEGASPAGDAGVVDQAGGRGGTGCGRARRRPARQRSRRIALKGSARARRRP
jgi:hypothetical protein